MMAKQLFSAESSTYMKLLCLPAIVMFMGCGEAGYQTAPVSGTVTLNGKPAENVFVQFEPATKKTDAVPSSTAKTDAQGKYTLRVSVPDGEPGAVIGEHQVLFAPAGNEGDPTTEGPAADAGPVMRLPAEASNGKMKFTVPEGGTDSADFDL